MKEIINLVKLDFISIKNKSLLPMVACIIAFIAVGFICGPFFMLPIIAFSGLAVYSMFNIAAGNDFNKLYGMLPIRRSSIVYARYMAGILCVIATTVILTALAYLSAEVELFRKIEEDVGMVALYDTYINNGFTIMICSSLVFLTACILTSIEYFIVFIFGIEREIPATIGLGLLFAGIIFVLDKVVDDLFGTIAKNFGKLYTKSELLFYVIIFGSGIVITALAALITSAVVKKREM